MSGPTTPSQIKEALDTITAALNEDGFEPGSYAYAWFCNIKMPIYDELSSYERYLNGCLHKDDFNGIAAKIANHLMYNLFQVQTTFE